MDNLEDTLYTIFLRSPLNLFDEFILECQKFYEVPAHNFVEMRRRNNKKIRGDIFEEFCILYLKKVKNYANVWLLKDVPTQILEKLNMKRRDMGIDLVAESSDNNYIAVQCKYKKHTSCKQNILSWKSLSTFYALCLRTGPWLKYIVMTNCIYTRHQGEKTSKDISICLKSFQNISKDDWLKMCNKEGYCLHDSNIIQSEDILEQKEELKECLKEELKEDLKEKKIIQTKEEIRNLRLKYYENI